MILLMMFLCFSISLIFLQMKHPLSMGLTLLIQTFFISLMSGISMKTFWYSYILFLIFMGGMLVLFIYMTSLSSNEMFSISFFLYFLFIFSNMSMMLFFMFMDKYLMETIFSNMEMKLLSNFNNLMNENIISLNKIYNFPINLITLLLINYLLLTLLMAVKITKKNYGPLRPMN
uniref:NADH-ubiquinone oxidoreductase chain 6 n=1 Tax=Coquillettidia chrysonotum TaxID=2597061 RepID=A0A5B9H6G0_9DIPT|nr:NADH dehydrogenase subunit 6 [Coquillettidia chrysonotum]QEE94291.1 NADH dehydrogenase subunit 6 [Coquillettidia chrysonotum]